MASTGIKEPVSGSLTTPPAAVEDEKPIIAPAWPFFTNIDYALRLWIFKSFVVVGLKVLRFLQASKFRAIAPTYCKRYQVRPSLECRVFVPKDYKSGEKLPLYIDIHGGGFALCDPQTDDHFCHPFANKHGYCVVSINYRKSPSYPWPIPVEDCAALTRAVLDDQDLPVDFNKVAIGGFSAGANLALAVAQLDGIKAKLRAVVPVYPAVDFTSRYRGQYRKNREGKEDILKHMTKMFNWGYVPVGVDRREKTLSPIYATRRDLPQPIYFIGAEYDVLCSEANVMAKKLAGIEDGPDPGSAWDRNGIKWEMVPDVQHGFTHVELKGQREIARLRLCADLYQRIDDWLTPKLA